jgi:hypothetical protein
VEKDLPNLRGLLLSAERSKGEPFVVELLRGISGLRDRMKAEWYQSSNLTAAEHEGFKKVDYMMTAILKLPDALRLEYSQRLMAQEKKEEWEQWGSRPQPMSGGQPRNGEGIGTNGTANQAKESEWRT